MPFWTPSASTTIVPIHTMAIMIVILPTKSKLKDSSDICRKSPVKNEVVSSSELPKRWSSEK